MLELNGCVSGECKKIKFLDLQFLETTKVTSKGVVMALENLHSFTALKHHSTAKALHKIHQRALKTRSAISRNSSYISLISQSIPYTSLSGIGQSF
jgi:hypothetical protein